MLPCHTRPLFVVLALLALAPSSSHGQQPLPAALADTAVAGALADIDTRRDRIAAWLAEIGGIVSPSGQERARADAVAAEMRRIGLQQATDRASVTARSRFTGGASSATAPPATRSAAACPT